MTALAVVGGLMAIVATSTGEAGEAAAEKVRGAGGVLEGHEALGERARNLMLFGALAAGALTAFGIRMHGRAPAWARLAAGLPVLLLHIFTAWTVASAAHQGARLVHELGVRAPFPGASEYMTWRL